MNDSVFQVKDCNKIENVITENIDITDDVSDVDMETSQLEHDSQNIGNINWNEDLINNSLYNISEDFYELNVSDLKKIMKYYELSYGRMKKNEIIETLILYESNEMNMDTVNKRRRYWQYMYELLNDKFMMEYIHGF